MDEQETKELGFADIMKELGKIMESLQKIIPSQSEPEPEPEPTPEPETETEPTPAPQPEPQPEEEPKEDDAEGEDVGDADEIDKILKDC